MHIFNIHPLLNAQTAQQTRYNPAPEPDNEPAPLDPDCLDAAINSATGLKTLPDLDSNSLAMPACFWQLHAQYTSFVTCAGLLDLHLTG